MNDALASLRQWGIVFQIGAGKHTFRIPPLPAADWIEAILTGDIGELLESDDADDLTTLVSDGDVTAGDLERVFADIVAEASGREWQVGARIAALLIDVQVRGEVLAVIDPATRPLAAVLDVTYAVVVRWMALAGKEKRAEFDGYLNAPPESLPGTSDPRERARQMRERSKQLLAEQSAATGTPSSEPPPTSH